MAKISYYTATPKSDLQQQQHTVGVLVIENSSYFLRLDSGELIEIDKKTLEPIPKKAYKHFKNKHNI